MQLIIKYFICLLSGYMIGSILFAEILIKLTRGRDIRRMGNTNPGAQNIYLHISKVLGAITGILDAFKSFIPMIIADRYFELPDFALGLIGIGALYGHIYPLYFRFKGGKGAAVIMGIFLFFVRRELLIAFVIVPIIVYIIFKKNQSVWLPFAVLMTTATTAMFFNYSPEVKIIIISTVILGWTYNIRALPVMVKMILHRE
ncbi:MAG: glycerol-3-phosphate acyltransferase [Candidatus Neomarinimicrobiota bacterium]|nr:MAG: glycerol-3-phosphate acyltransferase [Candidatus Neomarinimicrobiota bacterium]